jgi:hypothetical protein
LYQYDIWYMSLCIDDRLVCRFVPAHQTVIYIELHIPDVVLIQLIHDYPKHVENINKHTRKRELCVKLVIYRDRSSSSVDLLQIYRTQLHTTVYITSNLSHTITYHSALSQNISL